MASQGPPEDVIRRYVERHGQTTVGIEAFEQTWQIERLGARDRRLIAAALERVGLEVDPPLQRASRRDRITLRMAVVEEPAPPPPLEETVEPPPGAAQEPEPQPEREGPVATSPHDPVLHEPAPSQVLPMPHVPRFVKRLLGRGRRSEPPREPPAPPPEPPEPEAESDQVREAVAEPPEPSVVEGAAPPAGGVPTFPENVRQSRRTPTLLAAGAAGLMVIGALGPWGKSIFVTDYGLDRDGAPVIIAAAVAAVLLFIHVRRGARVLPLLAAVLGAGAAGVVAADFRDLVDDTFIGPAWGVYAAFVGSACLVAFSMSLLARRD